MNFCHFVWDMTLFKIILDKKCLIIIKENPLVTLKIDEKMMGGVL